LLTPGAGTEFLDSLARGMDRVIEETAAVDEHAAAALKESVAFSLAESQPTTTLLTGTFDQLVAVRESGGLEAHAGIDKGDGIARVETLLRKAGFPDYRITAVAQLEPTGIRLTVTDSLGKRIERFYSDTMTMGVEPDCEQSDPNCTLVGVAVGGGSALACAFLVPVGPFGWVAALTCGLIGVVLATGADAVCEEFTTEDCDSAAQVSVTSVSCQDWYCNIGLLLINDSNQPFQESRIIMAWQDSNGLNVSMNSKYFRNTINYIAPGYNVKRQENEITAPRDTVKCTTQVWFYVNAYWTGETASTGAMTAPKVNQYCS